MLFWKSLWDNDHAIIYLAEKHLSTAPRKTWASLPGWVKTLAFCCVGFLALIAFMVFSLLVIQDGFLGLLSAGIMGLFLCVYGFLFWGAYRTWTLGTLLSKLRQGRALPTFLYTAVSLEDTVDVLAARTCRQLVAFLLVPYVGIVLTSLAMAQDHLPWWSVSAGVTLMLAYLGALGAFGLTAIHAGAGDSGPKAVGKGILVCLASFYLPTVAAGICAGVLPQTAGIVVALMSIYYLYLPWLFRKLAIKWLKAEPSSQKRELAAGLFAGIKSALPRFSGAYFFKGLADSNPVLTRKLSSQNLLLPVGLGLGLLFVGTQMVSPLASDVQQNQQLAWFEVHVITWLTAVGVALAAFMSSQSSVSQEERSGSLDVLRSTPLSSTTVIDGWAVGAYWAYWLAAAALMCWQLPGHWEALAFALILPVCASYGGIISGLKDTSGIWIWGAVAGVVFFSWVGIPAAFAAGSVHAHGELAVFLLVAAYYLRARARFIYGG